MIVLRPRAFGVLALAIALASLIAACATRSAAVPTVPSVHESALGPRLTGTYHIVYNFKGAPDGASPQGTLVSLSGTLYGTTQGGGTNSGTVFSLTPAGVENVIHDFGATGDGLVPEAGLAILNGTLYGTTASDTSGTRCGTVFSITPGGVENVVHLFANSPDGCSPQAPVIAVGGNLYGTTFSGGSSHHSNGIVFRLSPSGVEKILHAFGAMPDGADPAAGLLDVNGTLYGTTRNGGANGLGTVFTRTATGGVKVLYSFKGGLDGADPDGGLVNLNGTLYGTTLNGGSGALGTLYSITPAGAETVVYPFKGDPDGANPIGNLAVNNGLLYGVTAGGGNSQNGTLFSVSPLGGESIVHNFSGGTDGSEPQAGLTSVGSKIYGTTFFGGAHGVGTVFVI
ncbi:MAG TPA: choice-of-anchor tandem repeat GloVer-containing protein [Candidatus Eremiobacteraceae bacterium]|nr:choice-of-anchor tandem repeat GloVer-containing protein [Candidatus Eremiobacteraceae bacterium]